ncbi:unnamed protein product [Didymodactylos carnosus]|uniref:Methyltransferase type 11 domain-containing protein n=1 Tax=Didymodactylos carnosus TaxID=1234261 RepID=A0A815BTC6_9BILA|nr:unnamed protein product [Didymodactylos carnosus]CAF1276094.1 unnamed protein product [Didymodactylos carnosus]CAF3916698.1 unnamed protein product [Didymodactylos carnosus]CAF4067641.1 unnamed protein product [Didymodactylos carnosus]
MASHEEQMHDAKTIYDTIAEEYVELSKTSGLKKDVIEYTFFNYMLIPNECSTTSTDNFTLRSKRILDLGCGDGHYTRKLKDLNCSYILGVDISATMINMAKEKELNDPKGIDYLCANGAILSKPRDDDRYDIVTGLHYIHYSKTYEELKQKIKVIYEQLKPNGTFYSISTNVCGGMEVYNNDKHKKYGFKTETDGELKDGSEIKHTFYHDVSRPSKCIFYCYYFSPKTYENFFNEAGFKSLQWIPAQPDPKVEDKTFYDDFKRYPSIVGMVAKK